MPGGLYSPSAGDVLTAANAIDYWSKQVVIICTSGTRPASPRSGMTIWQTDTLTYAVYGTAWCETTPYGSTIATAESTTSTTYVALTTPSSVTVATGTVALVTLACSAYCTSANYMYMGFAVTGATTLAAADTRAVFTFQGVSTSTYLSQARTFKVTGLTAGANAFATQFRTVAGTSQFINRDLIVTALPT